MNDPEFSPPANADPVLDKHEALLWRIAAYGSGHRDDVAALANEIITLRARVKKLEQEREPKATRPQIPPAGQINAMEQLKLQAITWARADFATDDRSAELARIDQGIVDFRTQHPDVAEVPIYLLADRDIAVERLRQACDNESLQREAFLEAARKYRQEADGR